MKNSFGKGLESLIPPKRERRFSAFGKEKESIFYVDVELVKPNPYQPRKTFKQEALQSLSDSIRQYGILQPLVVAKFERETPGGMRGEYELIAGERRLLASRMAGLVQVPVIVREPTDKQKLELSLIENVQRQDLNTMEKAEAFRRLQKEFGFLQKEIGAMVGKSREAVANALRLLELPEEIKQALREEKITEGHAKAILTAKEDDKKQVLLNQILRNGISVRETEELAQKLNIWQPTQATQAVTSFSDELKSWEGKIKEIFDIGRTRFGMAAGKPKLTILFDSKKEVEDFIHKFHSA